MRGKAFMIHINCANRNQKSGEKFKVLLRLNVAAAAKLYQMT